MRRYPGQILARLSGVSSAGILSFEAITPAPLFAISVASNLLSEDGSAPLRTAYPQQWLRQNAERAARPPVETSGTISTWLIGNRYFLKIFRRIEHSPESPMEINRHGGGIAGPGSQSLYPV